MLKECDISLLYLSKLVLVQRQERYNLVKLTSLFL